MQALLCCSALEKAASFSGLSKGKGMLRKAIQSVPIVLLTAVSAGAVTGGGEIVFTVPGMASVLFSHVHHVTMIKLRCSECHYSLYTNRAQHKTIGMAAMEKGKSCGACHDGTKAFGVTDKKRCASCHSNPVPQ